MSQLDNFELGELFCDLRLARGLKMKDIANEHLSQSQLSKFENGQTMLSADKLLIAISAIHMSLAEFEQAYHQYESSSFFKLAQKVAKYHSKKDIKGLENILCTYDKFTESNDTYNQLNKLVIHCAIHNLNQDYFISKKDAELITTYLYSIEEWTEYELFIFGNTLQILSDEDLIFLAKAFTKRESIYLSIPNNRHRAQLVHLNIIFTLLERQLFCDANYFIIQLEKLLDSQDMFVKTILIFLRMVLNYQEGENNIKNIENYIFSLKNFGYIEIADFLEENLQLLLYKKKS